MKKGGNTIENYISDVIDLSKIDYGSLNLIVSSCGTGKTHFCANTLLQHFPDILPAEVLFITSRSIAASQLVEDTPTADMFDIKDFFLTDSMAGLDDYSFFKDAGIQVTTYDKVIRLLNRDGYNALSGVKIIIFDEVHTLFCDPFVSDMHMLKLWVSTSIRFNTYNQMFIGLTATPGIIYDEQENWLAPINPLCEPLMKYKAKNLWIAGFKNLPEFIETHLTDGKTIVMCQSVDRGGCRSLISSIPDSKLLVSKHNKTRDASYYDPSYMDEIRDTIIKKGELPEDVNVLVSTSTIREGFNLYESSGVKNIVCCMPDELSVTQLLGRCRYNVENLVVVRGDLKKCKIPYVNDQIEMFRRYVDGINNDWFDTISHLTDCTLENVQWFMKDESSISRELITLEKTPIEKPKKEPKPKQERVIPYSSREARAEFREYLYDRWVTKDYLTAKKIENRKIYPNDKQKVVDKAIELNLLGSNTEKYSFVQLMNLVGKDMGFNVNRDQWGYVRGARTRYTTLTLANKGEKGGEMNEQL